MISKFGYEIFKHCITKCELAYWNVELPIQEDKLKFIVTPVNYPIFNFEATVNILCDEKIHIQIYKDEILISNIALKSEYYKPCKAYLMHMFDRNIGDDSWYYKRINHSFDELELPDKNAIITLLRYLKAPRNWTHTNMYREYPTYWSIFNNGMSVKFTKIDNKYVVDVIYNIMDNNDTKTHKVIIDQKVFVDHTGSTKTLDDIFYCLDGRFVDLEQNKPQASPTYNIFKINELVEEAIKELN